MKSRQVFILIYIFISQQILSNAKNIEFRILSTLFDNIFDDGYYKRLVFQIENLTGHKKYYRIIEDKIGDDLQNILEKRISNLNLTNYIKDYLNTDNILEKINNKFNEKIDSLDFILLGDTGDGKSTLLNKIFKS